MTSIRACGRCAPDGIPTMTALVSTPSTDGLNLSDESRLNHRREVVTLFNYSADPTDGELRGRNVVRTRRTRVDLGSH